LLAVSFLLIKNFGQLGSSMISTAVINFRTQFGFFSAHKKVRGGSTTRAAWAAAPVAASNANRPIARDSPALPPAA
jgi:hypothetical protein